MKKILCFIVILNILLTFTASAESKLLNFSTTVQMGQATNTVENILKEVAEQTHINDDFKAGYEIGNYNDEDVSHTLTLSEIFRIQSQINN